MNILNCQYVYIGPQKASSSDKEVEAEKSCCMKRRYIPLFRISTCKQSNDWKEKDGEVLEVSGVSAYIPKSAAKLSQHRYKLVVIQV